MRRGPITNSELLPQEVREIITENEQVYVSGRPLWRFPEDGKDTFYAACEELVAHPMFIVSALLAHIPDMGNTGIPREFIGDYAVITGFSAETGDEIRFGVRPELRFAITASLSDEDIL